MASNLHAVEHNLQPVQISSLITISTDPSFTFLLSISNSGSVHNSKASFIVFTALAKSLLSAKAAAKVSSVVEDLFMLTASIAYSIAFDPFRYKASLAVAYSHARLL